MPTPDETMLNPITNMLETKEQQDRRLKLGAALKSLLQSVPEKVGALKQMEER